VQVLFRGHSTFTEVPDNTPPGSQPTVLRGEASAPALTATGQDAVPASAHDVAPVLMAASAPTVPLMDTTPVLLSSGSPQMVSVASVVTDGPALAIERGIGTTGGGDGSSGEVGRDGEHFASLSIDSAAYGDHGWLIVPSASNEYGDAVATAGDGFSFDVAAGEFTSDWVFIA
jgi:hypothetical protein